MRIHYGLVSILTIFVAYILGFIVLISSGLWFGLLYLFLLGIGIYGILMAFCRKCPHSMNDSCKHVYPGKLAKKLPYKKTGKYTIVEMTIVIVSLLLMTLFPLIVLLAMPLLLSVYLVLLLVGAFMIRQKVCTICFNRWCPMCPNRIKQ